MHYLQWLPALVKFFRFTPDNSNSWCPSLSCKHIPKLPTTGRVRELSIGETCARLSVDPKIKIRHTLLITHQFGLWQSRIQLGHAFHGACAAAAAASRALEWASVAPAKRKSWYRRNDSQTHVAKELLHHGSPTRGTVPCWLEERSRFSSLLPCNIRLLPLIKNPSLNNANGGSFSQPPQ